MGVSLTLRIRCVIESDSSAAMNDSNGSVWEGLWNFSASRHRTRCVSRFTLLVKTLTYTRVGSCRPGRLEEGNLLHPRPFVLMKQYRIRRADSDTICTQCLRARSEITVLCAANKLGEFLVSSGENYPQTSLVMRPLSSGMRATSANLDIVFSFRL